MRLRDNQGRPYVVSLNDFEAMEKLLSGHSLYSSYTFWYQPEGKLSATLLDAIEMMMRGGDNPGIPGITFKYLMSASHILMGNDYNMAQIAAFYIHRFPYPCFEASVYTDLAGLRKCVAIGGVDE